jgi:hypothetical protein
MASRRSRVKLSASPKVSNSAKRKINAAQTPRNSPTPIATNAPYGLQVQGDLNVADIKIQKVSADMIIDSPGKIKLDSHTGIYWFVKNTTLQGYIQADGTDNILIHNEVANGDIKFSGNDAGAGVTALTLDMSEAGAATFNAGVTTGGGVTVTTTTGALTVPRLTTTQRNALTAAVGMIIYNTTDSKFQGYAGSSWVNLH